MNPPGFRVSKFYQRNASRVNRRRRDAYKRKKKPQAAIQEVSNPELDGGGTGLRFEEEALSMSQHVVDNGLESEPAVKDKCVTPSHILIEELICVILVNTVPR